VRGVVSFGGGAELAGFGGTERVGGVVCYFGAHFRIVVKLGREGEGRVEEGVQREGYKNYQ